MCGGMWWYLQQKPITQQAGGVVAPSVDNVEVVRPHRAVPLVGVRDVVAPQSGRQRALHTDYATGPQDGARN